MKRLAAVLAALVCVTATLNSMRAGQSPLKEGPQLAGIPVAAATVGPSNLLPNIFVADPNTQSLALCVKSPGVPLQVIDNQNNVWVDDQKVANESLNSIHIAFAWHPAAGSTAVTETTGACTTCYNEAILMLLENAHGVDADASNPWETAPKVTNGPVTLKGAKNRLLLACSEIESAENAG
jgi:hypothetical protein